MDVGEIFLADRHALLGSLIERALASTERAREAQQAVFDAREYLRLLLQQRHATRLELRLATRTVRAWRAQSRWLAATALALQERANELGLHESYLPFPRLDELREEMELLRLVRHAPTMAMPAPVPRMRTLGRRPCRRPTVAEDAIRRRAS